jgi:hypothetical protein
MRPAEWLARQLTKAFRWALAQAYLVRDNDVRMDMSSRAE